MTGTLGWPHSFREIFHGWLLIFCANCGQFFVPEGFAKYEAFPVRVGDGTIWQDQGISFSAITSLVAAKAGRVTGTNVSARFLQHLLSLQRSQAEIVGAIADLQGNIERSRSALAEARLRITQRRQEFRKEVDQELAQVHGEVDASAEQFNAIKGDLSRTVIRAPASGQVMGLAAQTVGGVIGPGQKIMDVVPQDEDLMLETQLPSNLIDRVHPGLPTDIRFSSFAHSPLLVVPGEVVSVSQDLLVNEKTGIAYYLARVVVTKEGIKKLGKRQL
jgi:HlyD family type I secretion membrane fusion protein